MSVGLSMPYYTKEGKEEEEEEEEKVGQNAARRKKNDTKRFPAHIHNVTLMGYFNS